VPKHQRRIVGIDEKILALYARGNSTRDISAQLEELYGGAKISASVISEVIDSISADVKAWQTRPLDEVYPIVGLFALPPETSQSRSRQLRLIIRLVIFS